MQHTFPKMKKKLLPLYLEYDTIASDSWRNDLPKVSIRLRFNKVKSKSKAKKKPKKDPNDLNVGIFRGDGKSMDKEDLAKASEKLQFMIDEAVCQGVTSRKLEFLASEEMPEGFLLVKAMTPEARDWLLGCDFGEHVDTRLVTESLNKTWVSVMLPKSETEPTVDPMFYIRGQNRHKEKLQVHEWTLMHIEPTPKGDKLIIGVPREIEKKFPAALNFKTTQLEAKIFDVKCTEDENDGNGKEKDKICEKCQKPMSKCSKKNPCLTGPRLSLDRSKSAADLELMRLPTFSNNFLNICCINKKQFEECCAELDEKQKKKQEKKRAKKEKKEKKKQKKKGYDDDLNVCCENEMEYRTCCMDQPQYGMDYANQVPMEQYYAGVPMQQSYAGVPMQENYAGVPMQQSYAGVPRQQSYAGVPMQQSYAGVPMQQSHAGVPMQQSHAGVPMQQSYAGHPSQVPMQHHSVTYVDQVPMQEPEVGMEFVNQVKMQKSTMNAEFSGELQKTSKANVGGEYADPVPQRTRSNVNANYHVHLTHSSPCCFDHRYLQKALDPYGNERCCANSEQHQQFCMEQMIIPDGNIDYMNQTQIRTDDPCCFHQRQMSNLNDQFYVDSMQCQQCGFDQGQMHNMNVDYINQMPIQTEDSCCFDQSMRRNSKRHLSVCFIDEKDDCEKQ